MIARTFGFTKRRRNRVNDFPLEPLLRAFFTRLAPTRPLATEAIHLTTNLFNWGTDSAWRTAEGDGIVIAMRCIGPVPGDGLDHVYRVTIADDIVLEVSQAVDYGQLSFVFELAATAESIDVATDALLEIAAAHKLVRAPTAPPTTS